jgi:hypothetical protein
MHRDLTSKHTYGNSLTLNGCIHFKRIFLFFIFLLILVNAFAQDSSAENAAKNFVTRLDVGDLGNLYEIELSPYFKQMVKKDVFVSNSAMIKIQAGGPAQARQMVGGQAFAHTPTGQTGVFYYVRFKTKFPNALVFQDIYLEQVDRKWKVSGYWVFPAPAN